MNRGITLKAKRTRLNAKRLDAVLKYLRPDLVIARSMARSSVELSAFSVMRILISIEMFAYPVDLVVARSKARLSFKR